MNRAERRAAVRSQSELTAASTITTTTTTTEISPAQLAANRANAQLSTGAQTPEGHKKSSMNALKTGLTGRTVVLPSDDLAAYEKHIARTFKTYAPTCDAEKALVQSIADTEWRLLRIPPLEAAYYTIGRDKLAQQFASESDPGKLEALIQTETFNLYRKELNNLALQERRLRNHRKDDIAEFQALRKENERLRESKGSSRYSTACLARKMWNNAHKEGLTFNPADFGFDFSKAELAAYFQFDETHRRIAETPVPFDFDTFLAKHRAQKDAEKEKIETQAA